MKRQWSRWIIVLLFVLGIGFIGLLFSTITQGVFYSGDAGVKYMSVKNILAGGSIISLEFNVPEWVDKVWSEGYFPLRPPFVYSLENHHVVSFPFLFQILSSLLYAVFGFTGLFVIPAVSTILLWVSFALLASRKFHLDIRLVAIALVVLIFCSPITFYAATYWEHTFATLLIFVGICSILREDGSFQFSWLGLSLSMAVWLRPEAVVFVLLVFVMYLVRCMSKKEAFSVPWIALLVVPILSLALVNKFYYDSFLGVHSFQVVNEFSLWTKVTHTGMVFKDANYLLLKFFPWILFVLPIVVLQGQSRLAKTLAFLVVGYLILACFILPNSGGKQWGPRYFLPVIPLSVMSICLVAAEFLKKVKTIALAAALILTLIVAAYSFHLNTIRCATVLANDYSNRVKPGLTYLTDLKARVVIVNHEYIAQEFSEAFNDKFFFITSSKQDLEKLLELLRENNIQDVVFITVDETNPVGDVLTKRIGSYCFGNYSIPHLR